MKLHDRIIESLVNNKILLNCSLELLESEIKTNVSLGNYGDIDLLVTGLNYQNMNEKIVIEVKSHIGLIPHYIKHQLPKYKSKFPNARQISFYSLSDSADFNQLDFQEH